MAQQDENTTTPKTNPNLSNPYYNKYFRQATDSGPKEPWQDRQLSEINTASSKRESSYAKEANLRQEQIDDNHFQTEQTKAMLRASMKEDSWEHGITQLGFDITRAKRMLEEVKRHQAAVRQRYTSLVTTVAKLVVTYYTGGAGAALFAVNGKKKDSQAADTDSGITYGDEPRRTE